MPEFQFRPLTQQELDAIRNQGDQAALGKLDQIIALLARDPRLQASSLAGRDPGLSTLQPNISDILLDAALTDHEVQIPASRELNFFDIDSNLTTFSIKIDDPTSLAIDILKAGGKFRSATPIRKIFVTTDPLVAGGHVRFIAGEQLDILNQAQPTVAVTTETKYGIGAYGALLGIDHGYAILTSTVAAEKHTYHFPGSGVPAGQVHVYTDVSIYSGSNATEDWAASILGAGATSTVDKICRFRTPVTDAFSITNWPLEAQSTMTGERTKGRPIRLYPGQSLYIESLTGLPNTKISELWFRRERYTTDKTDVDASTDIDELLV